MAKTKMTESGRDRIKSHFTQEAQALHNAAFKAAVSYWREAERAAIKQYSLDDVAAQLEEIEEELQALRRRRTELRSKFPGIGEELTMEDYKLLGLEDEVGADRWHDEITRRPSVFDREIRTKWDAVIYKFLCERVGLDRLRSLVSHALNAAIRQLDLAGTHEEAQEAHGEWYKVLEAGMGDSAPPLLADIVKQAPELLAGIRQPTPLLPAGK